MPEVVAPCISTNATPPSNSWDTRIEILGNTGEKPEARLNFISPEYFPLLRIPLTQGRIWDQAETMRGALLAVINQTMARQYWPNGDAIGQQIRVPDLKGEPPYSPAAPRSSVSSQMHATTACETPSSRPSMCLSPCGCACSASFLCARKAR